MDPQATWEALSIAVRENLWEKAADLADGLTTWMSRGGFPPKITGEPNGT